MLMNKFMHSIAIQSIDIRCSNWITRCRNAESSTLELSLPERLTVVHDSRIHLKAHSAIRTLVDGICASVPFRFETLALKGRKELNGRKTSGKSIKQTSAGEVAPGTPSSEGPSVSRA